MAAGSQNKRLRCEDCGRFVAPEGKDCFHCWEEMMREMFQYGGSDSERESLGQYFGHGK